MNDIQGTFQDMQKLDHDVISMLSLITASMKQDLKD